MQLVKGPPRAPQGPPYYPRGGSVFLERARGVVLGSVLRQITRPISKSRSVCHPTVFRNVVGPCRVDEGAGAVSPVQRMQRSVVDEVQKTSLCHSKLARDIRFRGGPIDLQKTAREPQVCADHGKARQCHVQMANVKVLLDLEPIGQLQVVLWTNYKDLQSFC